jgi:DNA-binding PadR family transcriptional regulator
MQSKQSEQAITEARREYFRRWRQEHREAVKRHRERFWERQAEKQAKEATNNDKHE